MESARFDVSMQRVFARMPAGLVRLPGEGMLLQVHYPPREHGMAAQCPLPQTSCWTPRAGN